MFGSIVSATFSGVAAALALASLGAVYRLYLLRRDDLQKMQGMVDQLARAERDMAALCRAAVGEGRRVVSLVQQVEGLAKRQDMLELGNSSERPYSRASRLAQEGASIDDLIRICGLSRAEAELLVMLHGTCGRG
jgi:hypothetical protein